MEYEHDRAPGKLPLAMASLMAASTAAKEGFFVLRLRRGAGQGRGRGPRAKGCQEGDFEGLHEDTPDSSLREGASTLTAFSEPRPLGERAAPLIPNGRGSENASELLMRARLLNVPIPPVYAVAAARNAGKG